MFTRFLKYVVRFTDNRRNDHCGGDGNPTPGTGGGYCR